MSRLRKFGMASLLGAPKIDSSKVILERESLPVGDNLGKYYKLLIEDDINDDNITQVGKGSYKTAYAYNNRYAILKSNTQLPLNNEIFIHIHILKKYLQYQETSNNSLIFKIPLVYYLKDSWFEYIMDYIDSQYNTKNINDLPINYMYACGQFFGFCYNIKLNPVDVEFNISKMNELNILDFGQINLSNKTPLELSALLGMITDENKHAAFIEGFNSVPPSLQGGKKYIKNKRISKKNNRKSKSKSKNKKKRTIKKTRKANKKYKRKL